MGVARREALDTSTEKDQFLPSLGKLISYAKDDNPYHELVLHKNIVRRKKS